MISIFSGYYSKTFFTRKTNQFLENEVQRNHITDTALKLFPHTQTVDIDFRNNTS